MNKRQNIKNTRVPFLLEVGSALLHSEQIKHRHALECCKRSYAFFENMNRRKERPVLQVNVNKINKLTTNETD